MNKEKRRYDPDFKASVAIEAIRGKHSVGELSKRYELHPSLIHAWRKKIVDSAAELMSRNFQGGATVEALREKEREVARLAAENAWLQKVAQSMSVEQRREAVEMENPAIPVLRQVRLLNINRSGLYYRLKRRTDIVGELEDAVMPMSRAASGD